MKESQDTNDRGVDRGDRAVHVGVVDLGDEKMIGALAEVSLDCGWSGVLSEGGLDR